MTNSARTATAPLDAAQSLVPVLKAMSDEYRLTILLSLSQRTRTVVELTEQLGIAQPLVSHHLKSLREAGLITLTPEGRSNRYAICCDAVRQPVQLLSRLADSLPTN